MALAKHRVGELDGLRGWASLLVVIYHFTWELFGRAYPMFQHPVLAPLLNGRMAVSVFLVISGFVLTYAGWGDASKAGVRASLAKRYTRLTIPIVVTSLIVFALMVTGLTYNHEAAPYVSREDWLGTMLSFKPDLIGYFVWSLIVVFVQSKPFVAYNVFLWTMIYELWGSYLVLLICLFERRTWSALLLAGLSLALLAAPDLVAIGASLTLGALLALIKRRGYLDRVSASGTPAWAGAITLAALLIAGGAMQVVRENGALTSIIAAAIVTLVATTPSLGRAFESSVSQTLGRWSFPLYLVQMPILVSITSAAIVLAGEHHVLSAPVAAGIAFGSVTLCLVSAQLLMPVERATAWVGSRIAAPLRRA